ncbi:MAG: S-adenosylmethionine:tRNA ribosyltransferase-isomerase [Bacteroidia bacterium]
MAEGAANILMRDYNYELPPEKIALFPLAERAHSKLLVFDNGNIIESTFDSAGDYLKPGDLLILNETKVVQARLEFITATGARVELFCLEPAAAGKEIQSAMLSTGSVEWFCLAGNLKRWKNNEVLRISGDASNAVKIEARFIQREAEGVKVLFNWFPETLTFAELLDSLGKVPLPPYLRREAEGSDKQRYQTVFARAEGSVAAPTAGLHFTDSLLGSLEAAGVQKGYLTLHVGAGTFKPVTSENVIDHEMHREEIHVKRELINRLYECKGRIIPVGTTSLRTLESLYWTAVKSMREGIFDGQIHVEQWFPYQFEESELPGFRDAFGFLAKSMMERGIKELRGGTRLIIAPGYKIRTADLLFTNFHQPGSTLLLLVSACIGDDWKRVYNYALENNFGFLAMAMVLC